MDEIETIDTGRRPNDGQGDAPRTAWTKQNANNRRLAAGVADARAAAAGVVETAAAATAAATAATAAAEALARDLAGRARIGRRAVDDADTALGATDSYVAMIRLTAARTWTLPAASVYPPGQPLYLADESGVCNAEEGRPIVVRSVPGDIVGGASGLALGAPYQKIVLHSNGLNLWTV